MISYCVGDIGLVHLDNWKKWNIFWSLFQKYESVPLVWISQFKIQFHANPLDQFHFSKQIINSNSKASNSNTYYFCLICTHKRCWFYASTSINIYVHLWYMFVISVKHYMVSIQFLLILLHWTTHHSSIETISISGIGTDHHFKF